MVGWFMVCFILYKLTNTFLKWLFPQYLNESEMGLKDYYIKLEIEKIDLIAYKKNVIREWQEATEIEYYVHNIIYKNIDFEVENKDFDYEYHLEKNCEEHIKKIVNDIKYDDSEYVYVYKTSIYNSTVYIIPFHYLYIECENDGSLDIVYTNLKQYIREEQFKKLLD